MDASPARRTMLPAIPGMPLDNALATARRVLAASETLDFTDIRAVCVQLGAAEWALTQLAASAEEATAPGSAR